MAESYDRSFSNLLPTLHSEDFPVAIQKLTSCVFNELMAVQKRSGKVTIDLITVTKKIFDKVNEVTTNAYKSQIVAETQLKNQENLNKLMQGIANDIASLKVSETVSEKQLEYSLIISPKPGNPIENIKDDIKNLSHSEQNLAKPRDVIITKEKQLILKLKNKKDMENYHKLIKENHDLRAKLSLKTTKIGRDRLLLLGVPVSVNESEIRQGLRDELQEEESDIEIIKKLTTKSGNCNWLLEADSKTKEILLKKKRICINFERIRIVSYIPIIRCRKCQQYGHIQYKCGNETICPKCAEKHEEKECKSSFVKCSNCYFQDDTSDFKHRADSNECPCFKNFRQSLIRRL